jgi:hypothetical protein
VAAGGAVAKVGTRSANRKSTLAGLVIDQRDRLIAQRLGDDALDLARREPDGAAAASAVGLLRHARPSP